MSFATRDELKTAVASWAHRDDLTDKLDDFITLAEQNILRELKLRVNEASTTGTTSGATIALPLGRILRVQIDGHGVKNTVEYTSPNGIETLTGSTGLPSRYTVEGGAIRLIPAPAGPYTFKLFYVPDLTPLSLAAPTNWALLNAPDVYLYGTLVQLATFTNDDESTLKYQGMFTGALDAVKRVDEARRFPVAGGLQIKPRGFR